jgi:membrane dipeptidase
MNAIGSNNALVALAHTDYLIDISERRSRGETHVIENHHLPTLRKGGVNLICDHVGGETRMFTTFPLQKILSNADYLERALDGIDYMVQEVNESPQDLLIVTKASDLDRVKVENKLGIILALQGGNPIKQDLALLRTFYRLGIRLMNLTANLRNQISDSCMDRTNGGLSGFGVDVVKEMNRLGILIDIAQLSKRGTQDVLELSSQPVIASNSNAASICKHPRNLDDEIITQIGENGGVIGIHCLPAFLKNNSEATIEDMIAHMNYIVDIIGIDHVGLGPDLLENWPKERYDSIWGGGQNLGNQMISFEYPKGFESISKIPELKNLLLDQGYSNDDISKILGGNLVRVFRSVWKQSSRSNEE